MMHNKIFIVGLPRTGTTSLCSFFLDAGYRVAHTAYTKEVFEQADVIADLPIFSDYRRLDRLFPQSKFIYLNRCLDDWLPSIIRLLKALSCRLEHNQQAFQPLLQRSYECIFGCFSSPQLLDKNHLSRCFDLHQEKVLKYFSERPKDLLILNLSDCHNVSELMESLAHFGCSFEGGLGAGAVPHLNKSGRISSWGSIRHAGKVGSHLSGPDGRNYFKYSAPS